MSSLHPRDPPLPADQLPAVCGVGGGLTIGDSRVAARKGARVFVAHAEEDDGEEGKEEGGGGGNVPPPENEAEVLR